MKRTAIPQRVIERAEVLYFKGLSLSAIAKKLHVSKTTLLKYKLQNQWEDRLPDFTVDDLLDDCDTVFFLALQDTIKALRSNAGELDRSALTLQKLADIVRNISALAPMRTAKAAKENASRLMDEVKTSLPPEEAQPILDILQKDYERAAAELEDITTR